MIYLIGYLVKKYVVSQQFQEAGGFLPDIDPEAAAGFRCAKGGNLDAQKQKA